MGRDVLEMADRMWNGEVSTESFNPVGHMGSLTEIADGVAFVPSFANVSAFDTGEGLLLVDTGSAPVASLVHSEIRTWSSARLHTAVYSHGHIDHVFGVPVWEAEAAERGFEPPSVVAHEDLPARFDRYILTAGYNQVVNRRQFGLSNLVWPTEYRYPDRTYADTLALEIGTEAFALHHERGETDDHTVTWNPGRRVLCSGDLFIWASPNAGNPQKVQRYPRQWAEALRRMVALEPEYLLPGHGLPVVGEARVRQALTDTADLLDSLVDQTLELMNAGARLDEVIHTVRPPADLLERPYLRPVYDEPEFIVHTVWRLYGGWWDGNPATLKPAPERALARELADLAGGSRVLADRALELLAGAADPIGGTPEGVTGGTAGGDDDEAVRLAGHLVEMAWLASPDDPGIQEARKSVFTARAESATSTMARGVFRWAATESTGSSGGTGGHSAHPGGDAP